ncbi:hypothetical protein [Paenibacillus radicis (ex Xue et al. 2023)]|uniref:DUF2642 domain-containing protein n=1 Tax=Paenibacillus radicis (ex Xue et al. 2023) TaxID=2972489 RepID=A0ABT1YDA0_9BACL|nr:hypothetical protein [Paenibacillus radicis (ex Xue et al. 2023)]MCR8631179.1 hypothetical protein [Paenibacillus radicis (ex Xue et al. 2023)]
MKKRTVIKTSNHLQLCVLNNVDIEVFVGGISGYKGRLISFDDETIEVNDGKYLRCNCSIFMGKKH